MSGGSYNYLHNKELDDLVNISEELERMANRLAGLGYAEDAASESTELLLIIRQFRVRGRAILNRLGPVWKAVEWWDSYDWGEEDLKAALAKYREGK
jgi:hypothetical protein